MNEFDELAAYVNNGGAVVLDDGTGNAVHRGRAKIRPKSKRGKRNKFNAVKTTIGGEKFDSKAEAQRFIELRSMLESGEITELVSQPKFTLLKSFKRHGKTVRGITYKADFQYVDSDGRLVVEDVKGMRTRDYVMRMKLLQSQRPDIYFREIKR